MTELIRFDGLDGWPVCKKKGTGKRGKGKWEKENGKGKLGFSIVNFNSIVQTRPALRQTMPDLRLAKLRLRSHINI